MAEKKEKGKCADHCQIFLSVLVFIMAALALAFSIMVLASCDFVVVDLSADSQTNLTSLTYGQYRYNPDGEGCRRFKNNDIDVSWDFITGQIGLLLATACAIVIIVLLLVQCCCCRFCCSRCIMIVLFILAIIGMSVTFLTFSSDICQAGISNGPYPCNAGNGTYYAIVAVVLYIFTVFFFCLSPKPKPLIMRMKEDKESDPCLCSCRKKEEEKEETDEEKAAQAPAAQAPAAQAPAAQAPPVVQPDPAVIAVAAGAGAAAVANRMDEEERPPSQVYAYDDLSEDKSSVGAMTVPFYRSADVLEGDLYFDANTVA